MPKFLVIFIMLSLSEQQRAHWLNATIHKSTMNVHMEDHAISLALNILSHLRHEPPAQRISEAFHVSYGGHWNCFVTNHRFMNSSDSRLYYTKYYLSFGILDAHVVLAKR
ncbi:hypothetical protein HDE_06398 [Halotydeus destructor]|nr:hypothetical protein HDE_06398 [Halotydeus destructor]